MADKHNIQLFVPAFRVDECLAGIKECLEKGWTGLGFKTLEFEKAWGEYTGLPHSHFLSSNTVGLHLALRVFKTKYGWKDGDEIITTPLTFVSSNHAILYENLKPVFADVDETLCLDPGAVEKAITPKTRAVMFVGLGGNAGGMEKIQALCKERGIAFILDAAHMAGSRYKGKHVGQGADATVFSFQAVKNLPTADSGMICFADAKDDERVRKLSWLGINKDTYARTVSQGNYKWMYDVEELGFKYHGNSIMAAIALVQLKYLDQDNAHRRALSEVYDQEFNDFNRLKRIAQNPEGVSSRHLYQVRVAKRNEVIEELNKRGVYPGVHYRDNTEYSLYKNGSGKCPQAHAASEELLSLPLHLRMTKDDARTVANCLKEILAK